MGSRSIRRRLALAAMGLVLAVVAAIAGVAYREVRRSAIDSASEHLAGVSRQLADMYGASARQIVAQATLVAHDSSVISFLSAPNPSARSRASMALRRLDAPTGNATSTVVELWDAAGSRVLADQEVPPIPRDVAASVTMRLARRERKH